MFTILLGYNWLWVSTDQPHGTLVNWAIEPNAEKLEPGSFQPFVESSYDGNNTILINQDNRKILLKRSQSILFTKYFLRLEKKSQNIKID